MALVSEVDPCVVDVSHEGAESKRVVFFRSGDGLLFPVKYFVLVASRACPSSRSKTIQNF